MRTGPTRKNTITPTGRDNDVLAKGREERGFKNRSMVPAKCRHAEPPSPGFGFLGYVLFSSCSPPPPRLAGAGGRGTNMPAAADQRKTPSDAVVRDAWGQMMFSFPHRHPA